MNKYELQDEKIKKLESLGYKLSIDGISYISSYFKDYQVRNSKIYTILFNGEEIIKKEIYDYENEYDCLNEILDKVLKETKQKEYKIKDNKIKEIIDKIQSYDLKVKIIPYKSLKIIEVKTNDEIILKNRETEKELKTLKQIYNEIQEEELTRVKCFSKLEKIVKEKLNNKAEIDVLAYKENVYLIFKTPKELDDGICYTKRVAGGVEVRFSYGVCAGKSEETLNNTLEKIKKEIKKNHLKFYFGDIYDRF